VKSSAEKAKGEGRDEENGNEHRAEAEHPRREHAEGHEVKTSSPSDGKEIAFFSMQRTKIGHAHIEIRRRLRQLASEWMKQRPDIAQGVMSGIGTAFDNASESAAAKQAAATSLEFVALNARTKLGTEEAPKNSADLHETTKMAEQGVDAPDHWFTGGPTKLASGVLEVNVTRDRFTKAVTVSSARINNVARLIANRLLPLDLRHAGIPVRLVVNGYTVITLDEIGRVRVSGVALVDDGQPNEAQQILEAEHVVDTVFSKPLGRWGLSQIDTNDAS
jgi:flagellar motor switch/type III secretory pathway protein FliN